jgi:PKD repeat protein
MALLSCEKIPEAYFYIDNDEPEVGQEVFFINESHHGERFDWDFGDGFTSTERDPVHVYTGTGTFEVTLTITSGNGLEDKATLTVEVYIPTLLEIEVVEYDTYIAVPDASVYIYSSITDWEDQTNLETEGYTDENGFVVFSGLGPFVYYVDVWEETHDNYTLASEDIGFIRTTEILPHKINRFVALVDVVDHSSNKGSGRGTREIVIRKLVRKVSDVNPTLSDTYTDNWQELYNRCSEK